MKVDLFNWLILENYSKIFLLMCMHACHICDCLWRLEQCGEFMGNGDGGRDSYETPDLGDLWRAVSVLNCQAINLAPEIILKWALINVLFQHDIHCKLCYKFSDSKGTIAVSKGCWRVFCLVEAMITFF